MNIKLLTMIAATMCGTCFVSCDDDYMDVSNLPTDIQNEFMTMYPNAKVEEWEQKLGYSVVDFRLNGFDAEAWFGANGWVMTETDFLGENCQRLSGIIHGFSCGGSVDFYHICFSHYCSSFLNRKVLLSEDLK